MKGTSEEARLTRRLAVPGGRLVIESDGIYFTSAGRDRWTLVPDPVFRRLRATGALADAGDGSWILSEAGRGLARRLAIPGDDLAAQHQLRGRRRIGEGRDARLVTVDLGESPLAWLRARKGRDGEPMIDDAAFEAGERLRADFTRGQMMPSVTSNWGQIGSARQAGVRGGAGEIGDAALAARIRVERALAALGPELAGTVVDFCCFLKGIEAIERERNWPKRSARLVLQLGLSALARHYGFAREAVGPARHPYPAHRTRPPATREAHSDVA